MSRSGCGKVEWIVALCRWSHGLNVELGPRTKLCRICDKVSYGLREWDWEECRRLSGLGCGRRAQYRGGGCFTADFDRRETIRGNISSREPDRCFPGFRRGKS